MSAPAPARPATSGAAPMPASFARTLRFELVKLIAQWRIRVILLCCLLAPGVFVAATGQQTSLPADTVFGRWMALSGWAGPLVVLAFCGVWALPLLTSLVAGDVFAIEDRLGTWRHLVVTVRSPRRIFAAKALASLIVVLALMIAIALSATLGGLLGVGSHPLVGLDGHMFGTGDVAGRVLLAWLVVVLPTLAYAAIGLLGSVTMGRSPIGLLLPALLALLVQVVQMLPLPAVVRLALPSNTFLAWRGLFTSPAQTGPIVVGLVVSLGWVVLATALAYRLFVRRDFTDLTNDGSARRIAVGGLLPLAALTAVSVAAVAVLTPATGSGITRATLQDSLSTSFSRLYVLQTAQLHRPAVTEAAMQTASTCTKGGLAATSATSATSTISAADAADPTQTGPGNDWRCIVSWHTPGTTFVGQATFQLDVTPDGRYVADGDGPKEVNGSFPIHTAQGDAPNPLWQFDGLVDLLARHQ
ncbi:MAG: ABC transporter permease [Nocardioides sp.]